MGAAETTWDLPHARVVRVRIGRPEKLGAYTSAMCRELLTALQRYEADDELRCLIMTGTGRGFCSGGDLADGAFSGVDERQLGRARELARDMQAVVLALLRLDKPVVAGVNGVAVSGGLALALACDLRVAASSARLGDTSGRVGLLPDEGGAWLFPHVMGYDRAFQMVALAEIYDAAAALELRLVTEVVPDEDLDRRVLEVAAAIAARSPVAVRVAKRLMRSAQGSDVEQSMELAQLAVLSVNTGADAVEGIAAFREKRPPNFAGR